jgi:hypothetical protein
MKILGQSLLTLFSTKRSQGTTSTTEPQLRSGPSLQPKSDASDVSQSRGADLGQARVRMGWGEGIPPSRDRD